jgi:hypothetical protein
MSLNVAERWVFAPVPNLMASQKRLKTANGLISLAYNQTVISLNTAEGGFLRLRQI